jgi:HEAT repeat protein
LAPGIVEVAAPPAELLSAERSTALAEFARACKSAARAVSLYPRTHPSIRTALDRLTGSATRLMSGPALALVVHPDRLVLDGRTAARPDLAVAELAALMHERLVGELVIDSAADADDWHAFLVLLGSASADLIAGGGFARSWATTGRQHFTIREIDYAEVLRERGSARDADWDHVIACCLNGGAAALDERAIAALIDAVGDQELFAALVDRLQATGSGSKMSIDARAAALLEMLRGAMDALTTQGADAERVLQTAADALPRFTPELLLALFKQKSQDDSPLAPVADGILSRVTDTSIAGFVATSIEAERGATDRLAQALEALVPDGDHKSSVLELAEQVARTSTGQPSGFESLWQGAKEMLLSYSDTSFVSSEYARELSSARRHAVDVERTSDDPPERIEGWIATLSETSIQELDRLLLCDLLRIESDAAKWARVVDSAIPEVERHTLLGNPDGARALLEPIAGEATGKGRWDFSPAANKALERLSTGPLVKHIVQHLRRVEDADVQRLRDLCHAIGPSLARPLAEALAAEDNTRSVRRLRDLLLSFGAAGRSSVEQLKSSPNPAVRRTAIDLLRAFGGSEALPELASMLDDSDPQVQRESIRAIVQIATADAYAVLQRALANPGTARETMTRELIDLRDDRTIPMLCYLLDHTRPRGTLAALHLAVIDALGGLNAHDTSVQTLRRVLYAGTWWAPLRTAALRKTAAASLRRLGSHEALQVLQEAADTGSRGVRNAARPEAAAAMRRERERA